MAAVAAACWSAGEAGERLAGRGQGDVVLRRRASRTSVEAV